LGIIVKKGFAVYGVRFGLCCIALKAETTKNGMALEGEIYNYQANSTTPFRGLWSAQDNGDVIQRFETYNADTQSWDVWFEGLYVRQ
jgi:hypothetical protein